MTKSLTTIGEAEKVALPTYGLSDIPARVDTGANTSAIWASEVKLNDGILSFKLFNQNSKFFEGSTIKTRDFSVHKVASSNGKIDQRYGVKLVVQVAGRRIRARFTLADRATQVYPILLGRNILRGKFIVDVTQGQPSKRGESLRAKHKSTVILKED